MTILIGLYEFMNLFISVPILCLLMNIINMGCSAFNFTPSQIAAMSEAEEARVILL